MNNAINNLLSQVYELEGLLLVIERHKGDVSPFIYEMIQKKAERIGELSPLCTPEIFLQEENKYEQSKEEFHSEDLQQITIEENSYIDNYSPKEEDEMGKIETHEEENNEGYDVSEEFHEVETESEMISEDDKEFVVNNIEEIESEEEPIKLDEALQRTLSKDLSRAFSLNDRFRYRRELFSNSEVEMRNTLNIVEAMQSYSEAEDYFYGDLEWDRESIEVQDFMTIIKNHFL